MYKLTKTNIVAFLTATLAMVVALTVAMPASAYWSPRSSGDDNDIKVSVNNSAQVTNTVQVNAKTGGNTANGGDGEEGGNGGDAEGSGDNMGGNGGNGGSGALGGLVQTGDAVAYATLMNDVNTVKTRVTDSCGCDNDRPSYRTPSFHQQQGSDDNDIRVRLSNDASLMNNVGVDAKTGGNVANGGDGEEGGNGGDAENEGNRHQSRMMMPFFGFWSSDDNTGGNGGTGGSGGVGGELYTGKATSGADVVNVVNRTVTRVTR